MKQMYAGREIDHDETTMGKTFYTVTEHHDGWDDSYSEHWDLDEARDAFAEACECWPEASYELAEWEDRVEYAEYIRAIETRG